MFQYLRHRYPFFHYNEMKSGDEMGVGCCPREHRCVQFRSCGQLPNQREPLSTCRFGYYCNVFPLSSKGADASCHLEEKCVRSYWDYFDYFCYFKKEDYEMAGVYMFAFLLMPKQRYLEEFKVDFSKKLTTGQFFF